MTDTFDFKKWQDSYLLKAKQMLLMHGEIPPVAILYALRSTLDPRLKLSDIQGMEAQGSECINLVVPLSKPDSELLEMVCERASPETKEIIEQLRQAGKALNVEDPDAYILGSFLAQKGLNRESLATVHLKMCLQASKAIGYLRIQEMAWMPLDAIKPGETTIAEDDERFRRCIIVYMETDGGDRMLFQPFYREGMGNERIVFGEVEDHVPENFPGLPVRLLDFKNDPLPDMPPTKKAPKPTLN
jgi:hypothetical protein